MQAMDHIALMSTSGVASIITDSANSASAYLTGHKTSVNALGVYADSGDNAFAHPKQELLSVYAKQMLGMKVGVVSTAEIQDASPASVYAHVRQRAEKAAITAQAINGCPSCLQPVAPNVLMGGGGEYFLPNCSVDGSNMYANFTAAGYIVTHSRAQMAAAAADPATKKLLSIAHRLDMNVWLDRVVLTENTDVAANDPTGNGAALTDQPSLDEMTMAALDVLWRADTEGNGFYLLVEAASIDTSAHPMDIPRALSDFIELDIAVAKVLEWTQTRGDCDTLVIATTRTALMCLDPVAPVREYGVPPFFPSRSRRLRS
eukprot:TRINITY_DN9084_c0_g1_i1.p1 TRINITY_DN9084_c0_g1~~TRINITY_DN9084_c0_g1_i1.p1  ORF type:complete len:317 (+),score=90.01 TRINITY_DN9084_c0_g1_i1:82-1032(+)